MNNQNQTKANQTSTNSQTTTNQATKIIGNIPNQTSSSNSQTINSTPTRIITNKPTSTATSSIQTTSTTTIVNKPINQTQSSSLSKPSYVVRQTTSQKATPTTKNVIKKTHTPTIKLDEKFSQQLQKIKANRKEFRKLKRKIKEIKKMNRPHKVDKSVSTKLQASEIIKLINVDKFATNDYQYEHILKGINLTIYKGEFIVIIGPSGSGKTTLLTILSALDRPSKGNCIMFDKNTVNLNQAQLTKLRAQHVGYIFQQYGLLQDLSVEDNIKIATNLNKQGKNKKMDIETLLDSVGLLKYRKQKAMNLSGGQSQRVAICRALVKNPDILFGDEPTGAIHISATKEIMNIFLDINQKFKTTIIIVTHNHAITELADRVITIESGKITKDFKNERRKKVEEINWSL